MDNPFIKINKAKEQEKIQLEIAEKLNSESYRKAYERGVDAYKTYDPIVRQHLHHLREAYNAIEYKYGEYGRTFGRKDGHDMIAGCVSEFVYKPGWIASYMSIGYWSWFYDDPANENEPVTYYFIELRYNDDGELYLLIQNRLGHEAKCRLQEAELIETLKDLYASSI